MRVLDGGSVAQRLRLISGLILFAFALTHFLNLAVGLVSIEAMNQVQSWRTAVTHTVVGGLVLALALIVHAGLALAKLARRTTLRMPAWELIQILLGLAVPVYLFQHVAAARLSRELYGIDPLYDFELFALWPGKAIEQSLLLLIVWAHGCIGIHFWLRIRPWYDRAFPLLLALAVLVPFASLAGFVVSGRTARALYGTPDGFQELRALTGWPTRAEWQTLIGISDKALAGFALLLGLALLVFAGRWMARRWLTGLTVTFAPDTTVRTRRGPTLLEISRMHGLPHASVCGGRARCSTCRVRIDAGGERLPPPGPAEAETLARIDADADVRLACQIRPEAPLTVTRLVNPRTIVTRGRLARHDESEGVERTCAVLFLDVRGFTGLSENRLPYDVVFILNRLFAAAGAAIAAHDGWIDKYLGDGLMAVFGRACGPEQACRQALAAARAIDLALDAVNRDLENELPAPLRCGIGIHVGPLVIGEIGHASTASITVIGDTVNAAARFEAASKEKGCQLVVSRAAVSLAGLDGAGPAPEALPVRGFSEPLEVICVPHARDLPELAEA